MTSDRGITDMSGCMRECPDLLSLAEIEQRAKEMFM